MKEFTISSNDAGQRLDRFLAKAVPLLPASLAQKYIRIKRIKCNGQRIERDTRLKAGDVLQLYINDEFFDKPREDNAYLTVATPKLNIVPWNTHEVYDRLGLEDQYTEILGVKVPMNTIPVTPGRNLAVILEVAAMNNRQRKFGYNPALEFIEQTNRHFEKNMGNL